MLLDIVKRAISAERSLSEIRTHLLVNTKVLMHYVAVRAAIEAILTLGGRREISAGWFNVDGHRCNNAPGEMERGQKQKQVLQRELMER